METYVALFSYVLRRTRMACQDCLPANQSADEKIATLAYLGSKPTESAEKKHTLSNRLETLEELT